MPANAATLDLEQEYADDLKGLQERTVVQVTERYHSINPEALDLSFRRFLPAAAQIIAEGQAQAQRTTGRFMRDLYRLETGKHWAPEPPDAAIPGTTIDGRAIHSALASVPPVVLTTIKQGRGVPMAMRRGMHVAARMAATETADASRRETDHQLLAFPRLFDGWAWVARGTCAACLAMMNNVTRKAGALNGHPGCTCVKSPVVADIQQIATRVTGRERFDALTPEEQARLFKSQGEAKAQALREGQISLNDLVERQGSHDWRDILTEGKLPARARVPSLEQDLAGIGRLEAAQAERVKTFLGGANAEAIRNEAAASVARARKAEPAISRVVRAANKASGGTMKGYTFRLKTEGSLARKISSEMLDDQRRTVRTASAAMNDNIRYTITFKDKDYWDGVQRVVDDLAAQGFHPYVKASGKSAFKDIWDGDVYKGINGVFQGRDGTRFELQFHTPATFAQKMKQHPVYEAWRLTQDTPQKKRLEDAMAQAWVKIKRPPGPPPKYVELPPIKLRVGKKTGTPSIDTESVYKPKGKWTPGREALHQGISDDLVRGVTRSDEPTVYMMGGGPASGKSVTLKSGKVKVPENSVHLDPDDIKGRLPEYGPLLERDTSWAASYVHEESSYLSKQVLNRAVGSGMDVLFDGTGDGGIDGLAKKVAQMRASGHRVVAHYVSLDTELAVQNSAARALKTGRDVPPQYIRKVHADVSRTFPEALERGLFDEADLYDTNLKGNPRLVVTYKDGVLKVHDQALWDAFKAKGAEA